MLTYRKATRTDIELIRKLANDIWHQCYRFLLSEPQINYMLELMYSAEVINEEMDKNVFWEIVECEGTDIGFISATIGGGRLKLNKLYLQPVQHGKGLGNQALKYVIDYATKHHLTEVFLHVNKSNHRAIRAYERIGFTRTSEGVFDIGGGYVMDDFIYSYRLD